MIRLLIKKRGQSTLEYAILVVVVIMALIGIQAYLKRGISGRMRESADQIGDQFSPDFTEYNITTASYARVNETQEGGIQTTDYQDQWTSRSGRESMGNFSDEFWVQQ
ncbi:MAG: hypothetical protein ABIA97_04210 [Candidatus Omnitrophota bacterium]